MQGTHRHTNAYRGKKRHTGTNMGIQGHTGAFRGTYGHSELYRDKHGHTGAHRGILRYTELCRRNRQAHIEAHSGAESHTDEKAGTEMIRQVQYTYVGKSPSS